MMADERVLVRIYRASAGTLSGEIPQGYYLLPVRCETLGTRVGSERSNGTPSNFIVSCDEVVRCVDVGSRRYVLPKDASQLYGVVAPAYQVVVWHDECFDLAAYRVEPCSKCGHVPHGAMTG